MNFSLVDRIVELTPGERIVTVKAVSLAEEYLADHFPTFPVLPGVLMLEALTESAGWLVRATEGFAHSLILLSQARNVTYKSFVRPGQTLSAQIVCRRLAQDDSDFSGVGYCNDVEVVKARFSLRHKNLQDQDAAMAPVDERIIEHARRRFGLLTAASALGSSAETVNRSS